MLRCHNLYLLTFLVLGMVSSIPGHSHSHDDHGHSHDGHDHDPPARKWSREVNEAYQEDEIIEDEIREEDIVDIPKAYSKEKPKAHGHSHGGHGHSHGGHGHSHGPPQPELSEEEMRRNRERLHKIWDDDEEDEELGGQSKLHLWVSALSATLSISLAPFAILFFFTLDNSEEQKGKLKVLLSFASGGLLGDAFLHLIPHAIMAQEGHGHSHGGDSGHGHSHGGGNSHGHSHGGGEGEEAHAHDLTVGLGVLGGILAFLVVEKVVRIYSEGEAHGHSHGKKSPEKNQSETSTSSPKKSSEGNKKTKKKSKSSDNEEEAAEEEKEKSPNVERKKEDKKIVEKPVEKVHVAGYLNLFADFFHNFTDGLAIGASFLAGHSIGFVTTFMILFHEIPHEIGDYAILIQSGVKPFKAKCLQLLTAVGAFAGCVVSLLAEGVGDAVTAYILPFTAGGFIYIATVSVIPELLEGTTLKQSMCEIVALLAGVAMMIVIAQYE